MLANRLMTALQVVQNTGKQVDLIFETLQRQLMDALSQQGAVAIPDEKQDDLLQDDYGWVTKSYVRNMALYRSRKHKKKFGYLALQATLYSAEEMAQVRNWEPMLYVVFCPGTVGAGPFDYERCAVATDDERLCFFWSDLVDDNGKEDSWFVAAPLTRIRDEADLEENVVTPVCALLQKNFDDVRSNAALPPTALLFKFQSEENSLSLAL